MKKWLTSSEDFVLPTVPHLSQNFYSIDLNKIENYRKKKSNHEKFEKREPFTSHVYIEDPKTLLDMHWLSSYALPYL